MDPEMSPREARRLETRVRREWESEKSVWKVVGVGIGRGEAGLVVLVSRNRMRINFGVPIAIRCVWLGALYLTVLFLQVLIKGGYTCFKQNEHRKSNLVVSTLGVFNIKAAYFKNIYLR